MERVEVAWVSIHGLHQGQRLYSCANRRDTWMHPTNSAQKLNGKAATHYHSGTIMFLTGRHTSSL
jgi:hypothetical protein